MTRQVFDGLTLITWQVGKPLPWDVTVVSTLASSYLHCLSYHMGGAAELAKYSCLLQFLFPTNNAGDSGCIGFIST